MALRGLAGSIAGPRLEKRGLNQRMLFRKMALAGCLGPLSEGHDCGQDKFEGAWFYYSRNAPSFDAITFAADVA